jgi:hypothetical protein
LELKAAQAQQELGDAEIARRVKAVQDRWAVEQAQYQEYRRELKAARQRGEKEPPHPHHNPEGWLRWRQTKAWLEANGRG